MKKEIREELKDIAPNLLSTGNDNPFTIPLKYFDNLNTKVKSDDPPHDMPEDYFLQLTDEVLVKASPDKETRVIKLDIRKWVAAASIIGLCLFSYFSMMPSDETTINSAFAADIELEEALDYLIENNEIDISEAIALTQLDVFEDNEYEELEDEDLDYILDEMSLEALDELF